MFIFLYPIIQTEVRTMIKKSILNPNILRIVDENSQAIYYGCNQEWYATEWQRRSGCGPSVASNIILYLTRSARGVEQEPNTKKHCLSLMEEVWQYVTPTNQGIPTTKMLVEDVLDYARSNDFPIECHVCDLPEDASCRPALSEIGSFLAGALAKDAPVAFLNRCNGDEQNLDRWHWVTIISLEYVKTDGSAWVTILDEGLLKTINLALWHRTTTQGGGFVYFTDSARQLTNCS